MNLSEAFEAACRAKIGHRHALLVPDRAPTYADFIDLFPASTEGRSQAARAAGYGSARQYPRNSPGWRQRRSYLEKLRRYETGAGQRRRRPEKLSEKESGIVRSQWRRQATPRTLREVLELINKHGATVTDLELVFDYDGDDRVRRFSQFSVGISPAVLRASGFTMTLVRRSPIRWDELSKAFLLAFGRAYGMGDYGVHGSSNVDVMDFRLGFTARAQYQFTKASRPLGAPRATGNRYRGVA